MREFRKRLIRKWATYGDAPWSSGECRGLTAMVLGREFNSRVRLKLDG